MPLGPRERRDPLIRVGHAVPLRGARVRGRRGRWRSAGRAGGGTRRTWRSCCCAVPVRVCRGPAGVRPRSASKVFCAVHRPLVPEPAGAAGGGAAVAVRSGRPSASHSSSPNSTATTAAAASSRPTCTTSGSGTPSSRRNAASVRRGRPSRAAIPPAMAGSSGDSHCPPPPGHSGQHPAPPAGRHRDHREHHSPSPARPSGFSDGGSTVSGACGSWWRRRAITRRATGSAAR
jgi:hypothetical protein